MFADLSSRMFRHCLREFLVPSESALLFAVEGETQSGRLPVVPTNSWRSFDLYSRWQGPAMLVVERVQAASPNTNTWIFWIQVPTLIKRCQESACLQATFVELTSKMDRFCRSRRCYFFDACLPRGSVMNVQCRYEVLWGASRG